MAALAAKEWDFPVQVSELIALESHVIKTLDWSLLYAGPLFYLERFLRIFGLDLATMDLESARVS